MTLKIHTGRSKKRFQAALPRPKKPRKKQATYTFLGADIKTGEWLLADGEWVIMKPNNEKKTYYWGSLTAWVIAYLANEWPDMVLTERGKSYIKIYQEGIA